MHTVFNGSVTSFRIIFSGSFHLCVNLTMPFFKQIKQYSVVSMYHILFVHFSNEGHIGCLQIRHIINRTATNMADQVSLWEDEVSFGCMAKSDESRPHVQ